MKKLDIFRVMHDTMGRPDRRCLFLIASEQHGYFTTRQALACGYSTDLLSDAVQRERYLRLRRGLYRLRDYPGSLHEAVMAAWLVTDKARSVVSHESALELLDLSDLTPNVVHVTVPRSRRYLGDLPGIMVHTTTEPHPLSDSTIRNGICITSPVRTILDVAEAGGSPEHIEAAVRQAIDRGLILPSQLVDSAGQRSRRVQTMIDMIIGASVHETGR